MIMRSNWHRGTVRLGRVNRSLWPRGHRLGADWFRKKLVDFDFWFIWSGRGFLRVPSGETVDLRPGVCVWMRAGAEHEAWQADGGLGVAYFHFELFYPDSTPVTGEDLGHIPLSFEAYDFPYLNALTRRILDLIEGEFYPGHSKAGEQARVAAHYLFMGLLIEFEMGARVQEMHARRGVDRYHQKIVATVASQMRENPGDFSDIITLARRSGYSKDHFGRIFKRVTGKTPRAFVIQAKIEKAKRLLAASEMSVSMIADQLGYENIFYFSKQFKEQTGVPPSRFRSRAVQDRG